MLARRPGRRSFHDGVLRRAPTQRGEDAEEAAARGRWPTYGAGQVVAAEPTGRVGLALAVVEAVALGIHLVSSVGLPTL
jgi:hypothetical protein